ncbi:MAG: hypothetical protein JO053_11005 [Acidobacteria bacterium]|nr:hypothetical protein [Acidobacteriota bacterium]
MNIRIGRRYSFTAAILATLLTVLISAELPARSFAQPPARPAATPAEANDDILDADDVDDLLADMSDSLYDLIDNTNAIQQIIDRWYDREDLDEKTQPELLKMLFSDVQAVVRDKPTQDRVWADWQEEFGADGNGGATEEEAAAKKQVAEWLAEAKKNEANYRTWFKAANLDHGFDPERVAGFCFKLLKNDMDDKGCWSLATFRGLVAYLQIEGTNTKEADLKRVVAFGKQVASCTPTDKCARLKAQLTDKFEDYYLDQIALQTKPAMMLALNAVGVQQGYDPDKFAGYCLRQSNPPDGKMGTCDEFVKTTMFAYWRFVNNQNQAADRARLNAFLDKTVRCRPPMNCVQIVRDLKAAGAPAGAKAANLDADGFFDYRKVYSACMIGKNAADPCARYSCRSTVMGQMFMWAALNNPFKIASGGTKESTPLIQEKLVDFQKWLTSLGDGVTPPANCH